MSTSFNRDNIKDVERNAASKKTVNKIEERL